MTSISERLAATVEANLPKWKGADKVYSRLYKLLEKGLMHQYNAYK